ncbi:type VI secretion system membrane subunit TssM [Pseudoduganella sp. SL102]|uniref:type VI secretion system membrane subunit TssM n=1 Tax=Pseudoduganella sp. SL102 TaxID=2995154 RepID=UPI00248C2C4C|nr:type VI secretion system membrane subunit TssM [Pseudoduganella sp. SL102]WBS00578.1 type VI secretion system membrane subunit TssM [Pseudoduganella sp. SL102]
MKSLLSLLLHRRVTTGLGLAAFALLIWHVGPLVAIAGYRPLEPARIRLALICLVVLVYVGKALWKLWQARRANASLMNGLLQQAPAAASPGDTMAAEELATLRKRFEGAVDVLRKARLTGKPGAPGRWLASLGRQWVYELPWYILIGAPGSGKTTALVHSGLQFPLSGQFGREAIRGVGGTRNCDWWFTDEAVLLDTAGRYTTQESDQKTDSAAWTGFLQLLKKYRVRRPINGALLTLSVPDLLGQSPDERAAHLATLRKRLHELHEELDIRFPLYLLVTKLDLLPGFMEFFGELGKEDRAQVWGMTFPIRDAAGKDATTGAARSAGKTDGKNEGPADTAPDFGNEFAALEARLNARLVDRMQAERDPQKRAQLYLFPQQFAALKGTLGEFVEGIVSDSRFAERPLLRGVYFTSGTQEGSPIDRMLGGVGRALQLDRKILPPQSPTGKSFFITRLLKDVVFQEAGLAGTNLRRERRRALVQLGALAVAALLAAGMIVAWAVSYAGNRAYVAGVQERLDAISQQVRALEANRSADVVELLPVLRTVRDLANVPGQAPGEAPFAMGAGLYQGDKLASAAQTAYRNLLRDVFLARLEARVRQQLQGAGGNPELLYEALKAYIMLHQPRHFQGAALKAFITADWESSLPRSVTLEQRRELESHLDALLAGERPTAPQPADQQLIASAREAVARTPLAVRIYNRIKRGGAGADLPEFTVAGAAGPAAPLVFARASGQPLTSGVPGLYSVNGYRNAFLKEAARVTGQLADEEGWVLGLAEKDRRFTDPAQRAGQLDEVRRLYLEDYARIWRAFVDDIKLVRAGSLQGSIQTARVLSMPDSPLPALLRAIVREVTLVQGDAADKSIADKAGDTVESTRKELMKLFGSEVVKPAAARETQPERIVDDRFDDLRRLVAGAGPGQPAPIDATTSLINELYTLLTATEAALKGANTPPPSDVPNKVKAQGGLMPEPVRSILLTLASGSASQALGLTRSNLNQAMGATLGEFCNNAVTGRYPFTKGSPRDVTQDDFSRLFAPGGMIDDFFQKNLAQYVNTNTRPWSFRSVGDATMGGSSGALLQFQRAQVIRDVFFRGGAAAGMRLELKPVMMDASITQFTLDVDGQLVKYSHGPQVPAQVQWPGPRGSTQVRLQVTPPSAAGASGRTYEGAWALFRLFDQAQVDGTGQPEKFVATFNVDGRRTQFEVLTSSVRNPFRLAELEQFRCPGVL